MAAPLNYEGFPKSVCTSVNEQDVYKRQVWGLSNEITMKGASDEDLRENHEILNNLVHEMDSTRLTTMACVSMCSMDDPYVQIPDTVSYNHYFGWYGGNTSMNGPWSVSYTHLDVYKRQESM